MVYDMKQKMIVITIAGILGMLLLLGWLVYSKHRVVLYEGSLHGLQIGADKRSVLRVLTNRDEVAYVVPSFKDGMAITKESSPEVLNVDVDGQFIIEFGGKSYEVAFKNGFISKFPAGTDVPSELVEFLRPGSPLSFKRLKELIDSNKIESVSHAVTRSPAGRTLVYTPSGGYNDIEIDERDWLFSYDSWWFWRTDRYAYYHVGFVDNRLVRIDFRDFFFKFPL